MDSKEPNTGSSNFNAPSPNGVANSSSSLVFSRTEFMSFLDDVEVNICLISNICEQLEKQLKLIGTGKDLPKFRERIHLIYKKTNTRIRNTGEDFECLQTVFQNGDRKQDLSLENINKKYCFVIKKYVSLQQRIVLAARQSDEDFWHTYKFNLQDAATSDEHLVREKVRHQLQLEQENILLQRREILQKIEMDVLDINRMINLVSGSVVVDSGQVDTFDKSNFETVRRFEEGYKDSNQETKCCHRFSCLWYTLASIAMILVIILTIYFVVQLGH